MTYRELGLNATWWLGLFAAAFLFHKLLGFGLLLSLACGIGVALVLVLLVAFVIDRIG